MFTLPFELKFSVSRLSCLNSITESLDNVAGTELGSSNRWITQLEQNLEILVPGFIQLYSE
jgi:hypothetical protein